MLSQSLSCDGLRSRRAVSGNVSPVVSRIPRATISIRVQPRTRDKVVAIDGVDQAAADAAVRVAVNR